jgi:two-component system sensor histidine kinase KdpD
VEEQADRLNRFVSDLLDLSRLNAGAVAATPELVPADELIASALQQVEGVAADHPLHVELPPGDEMPLGRFDLPLALRALVNLIENACKYSPPGSAVDVEVERHGPELEVRVADQGPGVPSAERGRIFDPFYRLPGHRGLPGTGLGLSIARRLAEAQGGTVRLSPRRGGGSVFTLVLPAADALQPIGAEAE